MVSFNDEDEIDAALAAHGVVAGWSGIRAGDGELTSSATAGVGGFFDAAPPPELDAADDPPLWAEAGRSVRTRGDGASEREPTPSGDGLAGLDGDAPVVPALGLRDADDLADERLADGVEQAPAELGAVAIVGTLAPSESAADDDYLFFC